MTSSAKSWLGQSIVRPGTLGFCTAGILMSLDFYLRRHPDPDETELHNYLGGHLCRCTGYAPILAGAMDAAKALRETPAHA